MTKRFVVTLWILLFFAWFLAGEHFLDWLYGLPSLGGFDTWVLDAGERAEDWRQDMGPIEGFDGLRSQVHRLIGV